MESRDFILLFFIIYDVLITWLFIYIWNEARKELKEKTEYIDELLYEIGKLRVDKRRKK